MDRSRLIRKMMAVAVAVVAYYLVHEGAHLLFALCTGTFESVRFLFPGVQIVADTARFSALQLGLFNLAGALATLAAAVVLLLLRRRIAGIRSHNLRAVFYYVTVLFLLNDPVYLSLLCGLFGGGDMNGIKLLMPEPAARILFAAVALVNVFLVFKLVVPCYTRAYRRFEAVPPTKRAAS